MKKISTIAVFTALSGLCMLFYSFALKKHPGKNDDTIRVEGGVISGVHRQSGNVTAYKGIPFAAPPVGNLRWRAPQPVQPWTGIKKCDAFGPSPMQPKPVPFMVYTPEFLIPEQPVSEDCLYLNVWTKAHKGEKRPVFVWIYGGGFMTGGTAVPIYDGEAMAKRGIIFVSLNYRVGVFGFLAHPDLTGESGGQASGNYGLLDQIAGLKWVKHNIGAFGGDPDNVTVAGQSAGSMSVNILVASPLAKGLFHKAISESGSVFFKNGAFKAAGLHDAEEQGINLARAVHAGSLEELRKVPAAELMKFPARYAPVVDGYVLPEPVARIFEEGKQNSVPVITGWNADDALIGSFKTKEAFVQQAREKYGAGADEFLKYFPAGTEKEAMRSQINLSRDLTFAVSGYQWATVQSSQGKALIYIYNFDHRLPAAPDFEKYGAFHTSEVAYVMDNLKFLHRPWQPEDYRLADMMCSYWINFIIKGDPNGKGLTAWPAYNAKTNKIIVFDRTATERPLPGKNEFDFLLESAGK